jgi:putative nucleotidyltransferase with HDIG domain
MAEDELQWIDVARLRVGMVVQLDIGWQQHPFPFNRFMLRSDDQIEVIRALGLTQVRYSPRRSRVAPLPRSEEPTPAATAAAAAGAAAEATPSASSDWRQRLAEQQARLAECEARFRAVSRCYRQAQQQLRVDPERARREAQQAVVQMVDEVDVDHEVTIRLLAERVEEDGAAHPVNVAVLALLLGRACGLEAASLRELGLAALLHDVGKLDLPGFLRFGGAQLSEGERRALQGHVAHGVEAARRLGLSGEAQRSIAEHHERADGSGYPQRLDGAAISLPGSILALVNHFDNLCHPGNSAQGMSPHEALAMLYARERNAFDERVLALFVRMMGIYPPGSVVELSDGRIALVVSATPGRPLRPRVVVYDAASAAEEALILDLNRDPALGVQRSLRSEQVPRDAFAWLSLRRRGSYYFDPLDGVDGPDAAADGKA